MVIAIAMMQMKLDRADVHLMNGNASTYTLSDDVARREEEVREGDDLASYRLFGHVLLLIM